MRWKWLKRNKQWSEMIELYGHVDCYDGTSERKIVNWKQILTSEIIQYDFLSFFGTAKHKKKWDQTSFSFIF